MPRSDYARCRNCGAHRDEVGPISHRGNCPACGHERFHENADGIRARSGLAYARQQIGQVRAAVGDPRIVNALIEAGVFGYDDGPLDESASSPQTADDA